MKTLIPSILLLGSFNCITQEIKLSSAEIEAILTTDTGYVTPQEIQNREVRVLCIRIDGKDVIIDLRNPRLNASEIIKKDGISLPIHNAAHGGDIGGGGGKI